ncbi:putative methyltransferase (TIGR04325 family) [Pseudorhizobium tarimense]|uniref:Methyltransferase (TIGR04325 family) n=1 Tax=Pseudorhizobium tarimense TaxID=1079109 RepID=A0ABV2H4B5_9HYPH|nr:methyltransferase, TIGR04325 family [Pseudorhizobium tarimense]MCJ8518610.1 methyltransferase, TIGR04325 family [Pseudorhizobium tarimense]
MLETDFDGPSQSAALLKKIKRSLFRRVEHAMSRFARPVKVLSGRLRYLSPLPRRFTGAYASLEAATAAAARGGKLVGYNHGEVAPVSFEEMCRVAPWDYPILFWLARLTKQSGGLLDAGGHMGTKFRAFAGLLEVPKSFQWVIYELPEIAEAGRKRAARDGIAQLTFIDNLSRAPRLPVFLASGLMQYLDRPLSDLLLELPRLPPHLLLNKVAFRRDGRPVTTLERIGRAHVPYQMRNEASFVQDLESLGYEQVDRWSIPSLSHVIDTHPELGASESAGFYFRLIHNV